MGLRFLQRLGLATALIAMPWAAHASPWTEVGDASLRSDIEVLAAAGVIDSITTHWPLPWTSLLADLSRESTLAVQPAFVRAAAERVKVAAWHQIHAGEMRVTATLDITNRASVVRGFDGLGREATQSQLSAEYIDGGTAVRLALGAEVHDRTGRATIVPDNSYIAQEFAGVVVYGGYLTHWWGPGWVTSLSLSNNARPMPHIGIARGKTDPFRTPWLSWLGPWQLEFIVGLMDDSRVATNTVYDALRFTFNPAPGLEVGIARTQQMCGSGHSCVPLKYYFEFDNDPLHVNHTNDQGLIDVKYSSIIGTTPFAVYLQLMNEDSSPVSHSATSHLFGLSAWLPTNANPLRVTVEYTDSVPTLDIFSFGTVLHGSAYNNSDYVDGMRYRGRTIGFSLDSDSTLLTLQAAWRDAKDRTYQLTLHHAAISNPANPSGNVVTASPVHINMVEGRIAFPWRGARFELAGRLQDDQPRPWHGFQASIEAAIVYEF